MAYRTKEANFNPLPSHEGRPTTARPPRYPLIFQSTPLTRGETAASPARSAAMPFQSTPLTRGETTFTRVSISPRLFQSTPLTRGETVGTFFGSLFDGISIHSPHTRGDLPAAFPLPVQQISIHSPHTRGDRAPLGASKRGWRFQSTPLTRGETAGGHGLPRIL